MTALIVIVVFALICGAYWLGWRDRSLQAEEDENFRRFDMLLNRILKQTARSSSPGSRP